MPTDTFNAAVKAYRALADFNSDHGDAGLSVLRPHEIHQLRETLTRKSSAALIAFMSSECIDAADAIRRIMDAVHQ